MIADTYIEIDGVSLEIKFWAGSGVPILLLHEGLGSVSLWKDFPDRLAGAAGHPVIAWSRQGHGFSASESGERTPAYMHREADLLPPLLDALGVQRAHLLGHSDGASIALIAAAFMPHRVASLVLEAPHVIVEDITVTNIAAIGGSYVASGMGKPLGRHHADPDALFWRWNHIWLNPAFRDWTIEALLPSIEAPALLIQGIDDEYGTLDQLDRIERVLPCAARLELTDCGHSPHRDQPEKVLAALAGFYAEQRKEAA